MHAHAVLALLRFVGPADGPGDDSRPVRFLVNDTRRRLIRNRVYRVVGLARAFCMCLRLENATEHRFRLHARYVIRYTYTSTRRTRVVLRDRVRVCPRTGVKETGNPNRIVLATYTWYRIVYDTTFAVAHLVEIQQSRTRHTRPIILFSPFETRGFRPPNLKVVAHKRFVLLTSKTNAENLIFPKVLFPQQDFHRCGRKVDFDDQRQTVRISKTSSNNSDRTVSNIENHIF